MLSRDLARDIVKTLKLGDRAEFDPVLRGPSLAKALLVDVGMIKDPMSQTPEERILKSFSDRLTVFPVDKSRVIAIEFESEDPELAAQVANAIAEEMVRSYGIPYREAVARINRQWSDPGPKGRTPRIWMVGLDLAYHETAQFWASDIYYGHDSHWWTPDARPQPLPPP